MNPLKVLRKKLLAPTLDAIDRLGARLDDQLAEQSKQQLSTSIELSRQRIGYFSTSKDELIAKIFSGAKMALDTKDISFVPHLALDGIWEEPVTHAWLKVIKPHFTTFDIGANFGYFGLLAAQQTHTQGSHTIFFEANTALIPFINKTLSINNYLEFSEIENVAISDKKGSLRLHVLKDYVASSSVHSLEHLNRYVGEKITLKEDRLLDIPAISIDDYCKTKSIQKVNLIKMDIEGYEDVAYRGMKHTVLQNDDITMFIEFTSASYKNPKLFYNEMLKDFGNVYLIADSGDLVKQVKNEYQDIFSRSSDWVMLVFSKDPSL